MIDIIQQLPKHRKIYVNYVILENLIVNLRPFQSQLVGQLNPHFTHGFPELSFLYENSFEGRLIKL